MYFGYHLTSEAFYFSGLGRYSRLTSRKSARYLLMRCTPSQEFHLSNVSYASFRMLSILTLPSVLLGKISPRSWSSFQGRRLSHHHSCTRLSSKFASRMRATTSSYSSAPTTEPEKILRAFVICKSVVYITFQSGKMNSCRIRILAYSFRPQSQVPHNHPISTVRGSVQEHRNGTGNCQLCQIVLHRDFDGIRGRPLGCEAMLSFVVRCILVVYK